MVAGRLEYGLEFTASRGARRRAEAQLRRARWAATTPFLVLGIVFPTYFVRIPSLKLQLGLSDHALGLLLTVPAFSAVVAIQLAGRLVARFGSSAVLRVVMVALPLAMLCLPLTTSPVTAALVLVAVGGLDGLVGVGMNTHAVTVERRLGRPIMSSCHAGYSLAAVATAAVGGLALRASASPVGHVAVAAAVAVPLALVGGRAMLPPSADRVGPAHDLGAAAGLRARTHRWRAGWTRRVLLLGAMATVVLVGESAVGSWSGVYLHEELGVSLAAASAGYIGFSICHAGGRLAGDRLESRLGAAALLRLCWLAAGVGLATVVVAPVFACTVAGFALFGLGLSAMLPVVLRMAGHEGAASGRGASTALSNVGSLTYAGMLLGPVVVGWAAQWIGLQQTFAALLLLIFGVVGLGLRATRTAGGPVQGPVRGPAGGGPGAAGTAGPATGPVRVRVRAAVRSAA